MTNSEGRFPLSPNPVNRRAPLNEERDRERHDRGMPLLGDAAHVCSTMTVATDVR